MLRVTAGRACQPPPAPVGPRRARRSGPRSTSPRALLRSAPRPTGGEPDSPRLDRADPHDTAGNWTIWAGTERFGCGSKRGRGSATGEHTPGRPTPQRPECCPAPNFAYFSNEIAVYSRAMAFASRSFGTRRSGSTAGCSSWGGAPCDQAGARWVLISSRTVSACQVPLLLPGAVDDLLARVPFPEVVLPLACQLRQRQRQAALPGIP
jgi:hypothetical protein